MTFKKQWFVAPTAIVSNLKEREKIMKKIIGILLLGLLGFLGCNDGNDGATTFTGVAVTVAPYVISETPTPTYEWIPVHGATKYQLHVFEEKSETTVIEEWYTAEEAQCAAEDRLCSVTPDVEVYYRDTWKVLPCAGEECGEWSEELSFVVGVQVGGPTHRFTDNGDGTVTDNQTHMCWTKNANLNGKMKVLDASLYCIRLSVDGGGWHLPDLFDMIGLQDPKYQGPCLTAGHPFIDVQPDYYWTRTNAAGIFQVEYYTVDVRKWKSLRGEPVDNLRYVWCTRKIW